MLPIFARRGSQLSAAFARGSRRSTDWPVAPFSQGGSNMADSVVLYDVDERVSVITLNRPEKLNAISAELQRQLTETFTRADQESATSVVLLRAEGRSFCAGYDISAREPGTDDWRGDPTKAHDHL